MLAVQHQVLDHGELRQAARDLECAREADVRQPVRPPARHVAAVESHRAVVRPQRAGHGVEQRGLAGAVRPDQPGDAPLLDGEVRAVEGGDAAETLPQTFDVEQRP